MASELILNLDDYDCTKVVHDRSYIYDRLPQKYEFMLLDGICHLDLEKGESIAFMDVRDDQWWCRGHIPDRPILPGVLMLEAGAHLTAYMEHYAKGDSDAFVGYGGVDHCKFRRAVTPPSRLWITCNRVEARTRRIVSQVQGLVDGVLVFEATVTGLVIRT